MQEVAVYPYMDEDHRTLYEVVRYEPKTFRQRRRVDGELVWGLGDERRVLYNLPVIVHADEVWVTEGEKDANTLVDCGLFATTNVGGNGNWRDEYADVLEGKTIYYCGDADDAGKKHRDAVFATLRDRVPMIHVVHMPNGCKDITDAVEAGREPQDLERTAMPRGFNSHSNDGVSAFREAVAYWNGPGAIDVFDWGDCFKSLGHLQPLHAGDMVVVMGFTGSMKTLLAQHMTLHTQRKVSWFQMELSQQMFWARVAALHNKVGQREVIDRMRGRNDLKLRLPTHMRCDCRSGLRIDDIKRQVEIDNMLFGEDVGIIAVDYLQLARGPGNSKYEQMSTLAEDLRIMAKQMNAVVFLVSQVARPSEKKVRDICLFDAKDSGSIENSASHVIGINAIVGKPHLRWLEVLKSTTGGERSTAELSIDWRETKITDIGRHDKLDGVFPGEDLPR